MDLKDFYFDLPKDLIAQTPLEERANSRLMLLNKNNGNIKHEPFFKNIIQYLNPNDCLILNETKVLPARLFGKKNSTDTFIELLLLKKLTNTKWEALIKPAKKVKIGEEILFKENLKAVVEDIIEDGIRVISFSFSGIFEEILDSIGQMPLPPYIKQKLENKNRYQTVYAKNDGAAAAPTAGLHFIDSLLNKIQEKSVKIAKLTLHVGLATFRPIKCTNILEHKMHSEYFYIDDKNAKIINDTKKAGGKIIAVGTTSCRALESIANEDGYVTAKEGFTDIFLYPGYNFKITDSLIPNFHLPDSSLMLLVSAICKREYILNAYKEAILKKYRFFSFGDAMFIDNWE